MKKTSILFLPLSQLPKALFGPEGDGRVVVWGRQCSIPPGLRGVKAIAAGDAHTAALKTDGTVVAWVGKENVQANVLARLSGITAISAAARHTVAYKRDGSAVMVTGYTSHEVKEVPLDIRGVNSVAENDFSIITLRSGGTIEVVNKDEDYPGDEDAWTLLTGLNGVAAIAADCQQTVVLKKDGTVMECGRDKYCQSNVPAGLSGVTAIAAGGDHVVALKKDGTVVAWGRNGDGQTNVPAGLSGVTAIAAGRYHTVALKNNGTVVAWGDNEYGQSTVPDDLIGVTAIAAGAYHTVALKGAAR